MELRGLQHQKLQHIKLMDRNCHIADSVQAFYYAETGGLNLDFTVN